MATNSIPENIVALLAAADKRNGLPAGTMLSVMKQEIGGQFDRFLGDPAAYHYEADASGRRIAKHTGKVSTAFGPFGILESTARDPGFGVAPLKDKSLEEQVRFAADYLAARSKSGGGLMAGLAGYGEGAKYANQVASRVTPEAVAPEQPAPAAVVAPSAPPNPWANFRSLVRPAAEQVPAMNYGGAPVVEGQNADIDDDTRARALSWVQSMQAIGAR